MKQSGVFVMRDDSTLVSMEPAQFANESDFQKLLARFPELLVGAQIDPQNPRRFVLVKREQAIATGEDGASPWSIDHLFLDQDGVPTLVEIKRQSDSRIRREVVGQMLDYAANCAIYWSLAMLKENFERTCQEAGRSSEAALSELLASEETTDYWERVNTNLLAGRLRLLFVADVIPVELRRIVEFLNHQMSPAEVLAIELRQFAGEGLKTIVPLVFGQTQEATAKRSGGVPPQRWNDQRIFEKLAEKVGTAELAVARRIVDWMGGDGRHLVFGIGRENGSVYPLYKPSGVRINPVYLATDGRLWCQFASLEGKPVFGALDKRRDLMDRFNAVEGAGFAEIDLGRSPSLSLGKIAADPNGVAKVLAALTWMDGQITGQPSG